MQVSALYRYPIKSSAALACTSLRIEARGPVEDRRWMLVDEEGRFLTGRQLPMLVRLRAEPTSIGLDLQYGSNSLSVPMPPASAPRLRVRVWKDEVDAALADAGAHVWLSAQLGRPVRLVRMDAASRRPVHPDYGTAEDEVSFADGFPLLLLSESAVDALSSRVGRPMDVRRFRPNLVISGCIAHAEDGWRRIAIGGIAFDLVKPCSRCAFTTVDPDRGERDADGEPLRTLTRYRRSGDGVTFGMNLIPRGAGVLRLGDTAEVLHGS